MTLELQVASGGQWEAAVLKQLEDPRSSQRGQGLFLETMGKQSVKFPLFSLRGTSPSFWSSFNPKF